MYTFDSRIRYSEIDRSGRLSIPAVVDYFQDCSAFQSEELGVGVEYLANKKRTWILNSWQIVLERRPEECEKITVGTWGSGFDKFHHEDNTGGTISLCQFYLGIYKHRNRNASQTNQRRN